MLKNCDFNDDKKDAVGMGSGHTVTAIYEIIPAGVKSQYMKSIDKLKYQKTNERPMEIVGNSDEVLTVKLRYKTPQGNKSELMEKAVKNESKSFENASENFRFAASVAELGLILRGSEFKGNASYDHIIETAKKAKGLDDEGYRAEFIKIAKTTKLLDKSELADN